MFLSAAFILFSILASGCSLFMLESSLSPDEYLPKSVLIVAEKSVYQETEVQIATYRKDISADGIASGLLLWDSSTGDSSDLKSVLLSYSGKADCGFFIGDIPPVWYEQTAFGKTEVFPSDLYYMDLDSSWIDSDGDGYYDSHSELEIDFYISRLPGTAAEINFYLSKLHSYRNNDGNTPIYDGAFIFKDDDWHNNYRGNDFGLKSIYGSVDIYQKDSNTTKSAYLSRLISGSSEYIYQWIHAFPPALFIDVGSDYEIIRADEISREVKGNFYNLFDCQAARFTVRNLASGYLFGTDSCIAVLGSTKTGGVYYPVEFHKALGLGACWGAAYKAWYNTEGKTDDSWYLGIITMGDPAIRPFHASSSNPASGSRSVSNLIPASQEEKDRMYQGLSSFTSPEDIPEDLKLEIEKSRSVR